MLLFAGIGALNWATGETVAVKEIELANIPKSELGEIMASTNGICASCKYKINCSPSPKSIY